MPRDKGPRARPEGIGMEGAEASTKHCRDGPG